MRSGGATPEIRQNHSGGRLVALSSMQSMLAAEVCSKKRRRSRHSFVFEARGDFPTGQVGFHSDGKGGTLTTARAI